jgi:hypothetical protein
MAGTELGPLGIVLVLLIAPFCACVGFPLLYYCCCMDRKVTESYEDKAVVETPSAPVVIDMEVLRISTPNNFDQLEPPPPILPPKRSPGFKPLEEVKRLQLS